MPKKINWPEIQQRYMLGEKPKDLAAEYGINIKRIYDKSYDEGWRCKKAQITENVSLHIESELRDLCDITLRVHTQFMKNLEGQLETITNPYLFDGERTNSLFQTAMNNSVKLMLASMKAADPEEAEEAPGFNVVLDA